MKRRGAIVSHFCVFIVFFTLLVRLIHAFPAKVVKITDGDTIVVQNVEGAPSKVRLYGIDCPEKRQPFGSEATEKTQVEAGLKAVAVENSNMDRYGRMVGIVTLPDGTTLQEVLLSSGLAWVYPEYCDRKDVCDHWRNLQRAASESRTGLWQSQNPVTPWNWRKGRR